MTKRNRWIAAAIVLPAIFALVGVASAQSQPAEAFKAKPPVLTNPPANSANAPAAADKTKEAPKNGEAPKAGDDKTPTTQGAPGGSGGQQGPFDMKFLLLLGGGLILLLWWNSRGRKKQEKKHRDMLAGLKKGDKITTIGGIVGSVVEVRDDEVMVKVDDNTRVKFARWAIRGIGEEAKTQKPEEKK